MTITTLGRLPIFRFAVSTPISAEDAVRRLTATLITDSKREPRFVQGLGWQGGVNGLHFSWVTGVWWSIPPVVVEGSALPQAEGCMLDVRARPSWWLLLCLGILILATFVFGWHPHDLTGVVLATLGIVAVLAFFGVLFILEVSAIRRRISVLLMRDQRTAEAGRDRET